MKRFWLIFFICIFNINYSQKLSPEFEKKCTEIEDIISTKSDSALLIITKLKLSKKYKSEIEYAMLVAYEALIECKYKANFDKAYTLNNKSFRLNKKNNSLNGLAYNYYNYGQIFHRKSNYIEAVKFYHISLNFALKSKNYILSHKIYTGLSGVYLDQKDFDKSLHYIQKSIDLFKISKDVFQYASTIGFKAETYRMMGNYKEAEKLFNQSYLLNKKINKPEGMAWVLGNWSLIYEKDIIKSVEMELEAEKIWNKISPEGYLAVNNLGNIGWCLDYIGHNDSLVKVYSPKINLHNKEEYLNKSEYYYKKTIGISKKTKTPNIYLYFSKSLADLQARRANFKDAYQNLLVYNKLNDSLYSQENKNKISELENAKKIAIKDKQIEINQLTINKNKQQQLFFIVLIVLLTAIGILLYIQNKNKKASNLKLKNLNEELALSNQVKNRFFNILNHDLRGPLAQVVQFLHFKREQILDNNELKLMEDKVYTNTENLLNSMEDLLLWGKSQMHSFAIQKEEINIELIFNYLTQHFSYLENYNLEIVNPEKITVYSEENYLKTICRNLTANAAHAIQNNSNKTIIWEAFHEKEFSILKITNFSSLSNEALDKFYSENNSIGIKNGLGFHLIKELSRALDIQIEIITSSEKTEIVLKINRNN